MIIDYAAYPPDESFIPRPRDKDEFMSNYDRIYKGRSEARYQCGEEAFKKFWNDMDEAGVDKVVIRARDVETTLGFKITNEACADLVKKYPDKFIGMAGVDPFKGHSAVKELEYAVKELNLVGLNMWPFEYNLYPHDRKYYPLYEKCIELDIPVSMESSMHFSTGAKMDLCRPLYFDYVAVDLPELKIIMSTPGWPWVGELVGVAWRHPNVYIATSVLRAKYLGMPNTGYEMLLQFGNSILQDKIIYGTGYPNIPWKRNIDELRALPLKEAAKEKWLGKNIARLLNIS